MRFECLYCLTSFLRSLMAFERYRPSSRIPLMHMIAIAPPTTYSSTSWGTMSVGRYIMSAAMNPNANIPSSDRNIRLQSSNMSSK